MATVIGVRFKKAGKVYYFDPSDVWPKPGEFVVVETARGIEIGEVVTGAREVSDDQIIAPLKKVIRMAVEEDIQRMEFNLSREKEAYHLAQERISHHKLDMKLVDVEYTFDNSKIIFYFTANGRVDFRDLVKDLAGVFKMRIELRQIGVRDEAKMLGGLGSCGRTICCAQFLSDFQPVSIKMAKEQNLSLNPTKISGQCGRLMCCLKYEQDYYEASLKRLPKVGRECVTPDGVGIITDINVLKERVRVRVRTIEDGIDVREYPLEEVMKPSAAGAQQILEGRNQSTEGLKMSKDARRGGRGGRGGAPKDEPMKQGREGKPADDAAAAEAQSMEQGKQDKQRERRIQSKHKSKQISTEQYFDQIEDGEAKPSASRSGEQKEPREPMEPREGRGGRRGAQENREQLPVDAEPVKQPKPEDPAWAVPKPQHKSVKPGDKMES